MILAIGNIMFFLADCGGQEAINQKFLFKISDQHIEEYETPGVLNAREILPTELFEGKHHKVLEDVVTYYVTNHYIITSPFGQFEVLGEDMLRNRIQEIQAIAALQEITKTKAFRNATEQAAMSTFRDAQNLIINPVDTVSGMPQGVGRLFSRGGEMLKDGRGGQEDIIPKELVGFPKVKRQLAYELGADVYSSNKVLQKELNRISWAGFAGGAGVSLLTMSIKDATGILIKGTRFTNQMNKLLLNNAPEDIRRINRKKLQQMGIEESIVEEFLRHPNYSPRHETILVHALAEMEGVKNRHQMIEQSLFAVNEEDAFFFQKIAEMMAIYHKNVEPFTEIIPVRKVVAGYTAGRAIVATLPVDYVYWTKWADSASDALLSLETLNRPVIRVKLFISGRLTPKAKLQFTAKGIVVKENM